MKHILAVKHADGRTEINCKHIILIKREDAYVCTQCGAVVVSDHAEPVKEVNYV